MPCFDKIEKFYVRVSGEFLVLLLKLSKRSLGDIEEGMNGINKIDIHSHHVQVHLLKKDFLIPLSIIPLLLSFFVVTLENFWV